MTDQYINELLKYIGSWAGINKRLTFHCSRDTFATQFLRMGGDLKTCSEILGHTSIKTTMIYLKMNMQDKQEGMDKFNKYM
jgi:site-specific recombinase XerD